MVTSRLGSERPQQRLAYTLPEQGVEATCAKSLGGVPYPFLERTWLAPALATRQVRALECSHTFLMSTLLGVLSMPGRKTLQLARRLVRASSHTRLFGRLGCHRSPLSRGRHRNTLFEHYLVVEKFVSASVMACARHTTRCRARTFQAKHAAGQRRAPATQPRKSKHPQLSAPYCKNGKQQQ